MRSGLNTLSACFSHSLVHCDLLIAKAITLKRYIQMHNNYSLWPAIYN